MIKTVVAKPPEADLGLGVSLTHAIIERIWTKKRDG